MDWQERENALRVLFTAREQSDPLDEQGVAHWARSLILHVQDCCAKRAEYGDMITGQGCVHGYRHDGEVGRARKKAADDIRKLRWGPDYVSEEE